MSWQGVPAGAGSSAGPCQLASIPPAPCKGNFIISFYCCTWFMHCAMAGSDMQQVSAWSAGMCIVIIMKAAAEIQLLPTAGRQWSQLHRGRMSGLAVEHCLASAVRHGNAKQLLQSKNVSPRSGGHSGQVWVNWEKPDSPMMHVLYLS